MQLTDQKGSGGVALVSEVNEMHLVKLSSYKLTQGTVLIFRVSTTRFIGNVLKGFFWGVLGWFGVFVVVVYTSTVFLAQVTNSSARKFKTVLDHVLSAHCHGLSLYVKR